jgi:hypothetical protein
MSVIGDLIAPGGGIADLLNTVIKRVWPDKAQQEQAQQQFEMQLLEMQQRGELDQYDKQVQLALAQVQVQDDEAKNPSIFISGARAFIEWVCGVGLGYQLVARPLFVWASTSWLHVAPPPSLDMQALGSLITMMLGIGSLQVTHSVLTNK